MSFGYSVVVPTTLNNHQYLDGCLKSLREYTEGTLEIVVVLNGADQKQSRAVAEIYDAKIVEVEDRLGYSAACNLGIANATGTYVVITNDDVLFGPLWNLKMRECLDRFEDERPECPRAALVGPSSNNVAGVQQIPQPQGVTADNYLEVCERLNQSDTKNWISTAFLSGFCMMISRQFIEEMDGKPFDERLVNGAEDNLITVQAMVRGYSAVACGNAFVYHYGSRTTDRLPTEEDNARGVRNLLDFYKYGQELFSDEQKVAACCRVRLLTEDHLRVFKMAVEKNVSLADALIVLDDRSDKDLWAEATSFCNDVSADHGIPYITKSNSPRAELNECRDRQWLLDEARKAVGEVNGWYLSFDADEVFEDKFDRAYIQRLIHTPHPGVFSFLFHFYTLWDEAETMWRTDGTFGAMAGHRLVRILPGYNMLVTNSGMHMGNIPMARVSAAGSETSIRIRHYGFTKQSERERKFKFYTENDKVKDRAQIGHDDYRHLIAQNVQLQQWVEDTSVTIGTCVLNEEIRLHNYLRTFWAFADRMVMTDTGSTDRTVELLKHWGVEVIDYEEATGEAWDSTFATSGGDLARARNLSLHAADTHWYWQIDPDEIPRASNEVKHPLSYMRRMLDRTELDAVQFFFRCIQPDGYHTLSQTPRLVNRPKERGYFGYVHETLDRELPSSSVVDYSRLDFVHTGAMIGEKAYSEKMKRYFRANLRMIRDYPHEARGWFNASLHFLDSSLPAMRSTGILFMHQAIQRNPSYAVAVKELCVQGFTDLRAQLERVLTLTPKGHPFYTYATKAIEACNEFGLSTRTMIRCPGHAEAVLEEPDFAEFADLVRKNGTLGEMGGDVDGVADTEIDDVPNVAVG